MKVLILISVFALTQAQFPLDTTSQRPWTGPIADHQLGIHPSDTAHVAAAKTEHLRAYQDVLAVLPQLPPEERYIMDGLPLPVVHALQEHTHRPQHFQPVIQPQIPSVRQPVVPDFKIVGTQPTPIAPTVFAEEIPRSPIGEVPEVQAAREAHLKAFQEAKNALPPLID